MKLILLIISLFKRVIMLLLLLGFVFIFSQPANAYTQDDFVHQLLSSDDFFEKERIGVQIKRIEMEIIMLIGIGILVLSLVELTKTS